MKLSAKLVQLERENDNALIRFWEAVEFVARCKRELYGNETYRALAAKLATAEYEREQIEREMAAARLAYLKEKVKR